MIYDIITKRVIFDKNKKNCDEIDAALHNIIKYCKFKTLVTPLGHKTKYFETECNIENYDTLYYIRTISFTVLKPASSTTLEIYYNE